MISFGHHFPKIEIDIEISGVLYRFNLINIKIGWNKP